MFGNYLKIAFRNLLKNKIFSLINILGLAIGLAGFILISTYIKNEMSYDRFHEHAERIYRPVEIQRPPGIGRQDVAVTMGPLAAAMRNDFPEVESAGRIMPIGTTFCKSGERGFYETDVAVADQHFFDVFSIPFISGERETALSEPTQVVISEEVAEKFFPGESAIGKTLLMETWAGDLSMQVSGVFENYPRNSHIRFRIIASIKPFEDRFSWMNSWQNNNLATYVRLAEGVSPAELETKFPAFIDRYIEKRAWNDGLEIYLQPLTDIHLHSDHLRFQTYNANQGSIDLVYTFSVIAVLILGIACINFMNLSTARSVKRAKEVGVRKVLGSSRKSLVYQFLSESFLIATIALLIAVAIVVLATPLFKEIAGDRIFVDFYQYKSFIFELLGITFITALIAGSYPAIFLSSYQPIRTLKGNFNVTSAGRSAFLRKALVVAQFSIALILIITTGIVNDQLQFIRNKNLGYNTEQIVYIRMRGDNEQGKIDLLKKELIRHANIKNVAAAAGLRGTSGSQGTRTVAGTNGETSLMMRMSFVDFDFIPTMEMEMVTGRNFSPEFGTDSSAVIINETAVQALGWDEPLGKQFEGSNDQLFTVIGVVKDFHYNKLTEKIEPLFMRIDPQRFGYLFLKVDSREMAETLKFVEKTWQTSLPDRPFEYDFLDEHFAQLYRAEANYGQLFSIFSFLAIFVACLGLFGLSTFTATQKTKEIGIRKVLGASVSGIVLLLSKDFLKWVAIAGLIAFPTAYFIGHNWLETFVYHTNIAWLTFLVAAIIVIAVAIATVSFQAIKAALANPVKALRYE